MKSSVCKNNEIELYHGTSVESAKKIMKEGFVTDKKYNWDVKSKKGFVYLSKAYAPFYAENAKSKSNMRAIVLTCVPVTKLYPEDDFLMAAFGKPRYTQDEIDRVNLEDYKYLWKKSLQYMGNVCAKPKDIRVIGMREFDVTTLVLTCDPCITPLNYQIMGKYYEALTRWIYDGNNHMDFKRIDKWFSGGY
jgi:hypothetical protein